MAAEASRRWEATFAPGTNAVRQARVAVRDALAGAGLEPALIASAVLVLGEMVANAVRHARTEFTVSTIVAADTVRIEVFDRDTRPPSLLGLDSESTSGRGLHIVAGMARDWGWQTAEDGHGVSGKLVWAELALDDPE